MEMNNDMMMQMMQMMMQNQTMMNQMMMQMMAPQAQTMAEAKPVETKVDIVSNGESANVKAELAELKSQLAAAQAKIKELTVDLAAEKQTHEATKKALKYAYETNRKELKEFADLKKTVGKAEIYLGETIEEVAANVEELSGDDYYELHKKEWDEQGLNNMEKHQKVTEYKDLFKKDDDEPVMFSFE